MAIIVLQQIFDRLTAEAQREVEAVGTRNSVGYFIREERFSAGTRRQLSRLRRDACVPTASGSRDPEPLSTSAEAMAREEYRQHAKLLTSLGRSEAEYENYRARQLSGA